MRIAIVSDAWEPQVNGVVRTLRSLMTELGGMGHEPILVTPDQFASIPCPSYREIRLALATPAGVGRRLTAHRPDAVHIATEGPLGLAARSWCLRRGHPFTTAYHSQFPDYLAKRTRLPASCFWPYIGWFHRPSRAVLASTPRLRAELADHGIHHTQLWTRGVDLGCFRPEGRDRTMFEGLPRPHLLYVGRIAVEKNVEAFLRCTHPGGKLVVGDGPDLARLKRLHPHASFVGALHGRALAETYAAADVLVFPSRTDTFGLVMIEALACGTPVAAFPVPGPLDVLSDQIAGLDEDLDIAIAQALRRDRAACTAYASRYSWAECAHQFVAALAPVAARTRGRARQAPPPASILARP